MMRINVNIAVVAMVRPRPIKPGQLQSECFDHSIVNTTVNITDNQVLNFNFPFKFILFLIKEGFPWDEREQGMVLGAFFWLHWITQLPGGMLAQRFGGKRVFGFSQLVGSLMCFLMPFAAYYDLYALLFLRFVQGFITVKSLFLKFK